MGFLGLFKKKTIPAVKWLSEKEIKEAAYLTVRDDNVPVYLGDKKYLPPDIIKLKAFVYSDNIDLLRKYRKDFDCDDFTLQFLARIRYKYPYWAIGEIVYEPVDNPTKSHSAICFYFFDPDLKMPTLKLIEPQTDEFSDYPAGMKCWLIKF